MQPQVHPQNSATSSVLNLFGAETQNALDFLNYGTNKNSQSYANSVVSTDQSSTEMSIMNIRGFQKYDTAERAFRGEWQSLQELLVADRDAKDFLSETSEKLVIIYKIDPLQSCTDVEDLFASETSRIS